MDPIGFRSKPNISSLQHPENMPSKHVNSGHHRPASETQTDGVSLSGRQRPEIEC